MKRLLSGTLLLTLVMLGGCGPFLGGPSLGERLGQDLRAGDKWVMEVQYWPGRFQNRYAEADPPLVNRLRYRVLEPNDGQAVPNRILVRGDTISAVMQLGTAGNVEFVSRILSEDTSGVAKTQEILSNVLKGRALFVPGWAPSVASFWFHPDMRASGVRTRLQFDRGIGNRGDWVVQTISSLEGRRLEVTLRHPPSRSRVEFVWSKGSDWWDSARWYHSSRLVARAERVE